MRRHHLALANALSSPFSRQHLEGGGLWDFGNRMILGSALRRASELETPLKVLAVWDGKQGDGRGGTADMVALARHCDLTVHVIDPMDDEIVELSGLSESNLSPKNESLNEHRFGESRIAAGIFLLFPASWKSNCATWQFPQSNSQASFTG